MKSSALVVLVTVPNRAAGVRLARWVVEERLAACANLLAPVESLYWWKGRMEKSREVLLMLKTQKSKWVRLSKKIREKHPYEVCEILALPVALGNPAYLKWIDDSLR